MVQRVDKGLDFTFLKLYKRIEIIKKILQKLLNYWNIRSWDDRPNPTIHQPNTPANQFIILKIVCFQDAQLEIRILN